jgi:hypothetical protein
MGNMVMGKCEDSQRKSYIKQVVNILKEDTENYYWAIFTHAMEFFKECTSLNKPIP